MATWRDGAAYAPETRPDGFATPAAEPLPEGEPYRANTPGADDRPQDVVLPLEAPVALKSPGRFEFKIRRVLIPIARVIDRFEGIRL